MYHSVTVILILGLFFFSSAQTSYATDTQYEQFAERKIADILPADKISGEHYKIRETVPTYGFMDHFTVDSDYGIFEVTGDAALRKLLREISALTAFKKVENTEAFGKALIASAKQPLVFGENLVTNPVDTVTGIPKGVARLFMNAYASVTSKKQTGEDSTAESMLSLSKYKREYAYNLGVDVYSSNSVFQKELNRVGWAAAVGNLSFSAATAPVGGGVGMAISYTGFAQTMNDYLRDEPPSRIRMDAQEKLLSIGVAKDDIKNFLENKAFTPRHTVVIVNSLMKLKDAAGRDSFIKFANSASDEEQANFMMNIAETMRGYQETVSPVKEISIDAALVIAKAENNSVPILFPLDYGVWTESTEAIFKNIVASFKSQADKPQFELLVAGTVSPLAKKNIEQLGIKVTEKVSEKAGFVD
ncbi:MAG: hypothetical protein HQL08_12580 [Nitrospirae bacterium]|nr:hypothetical protein [Nitrospirota bacterium]